MNTKILTLAAVTALSMGVGASMANASPRHAQAQAQGPVSAVQTSTAQAAQVASPMAQPIPSNFPKYAPLEGGDGGAG
jgi:hypothetical protein